MLKFLAEIVFNMIGGMISSIFEISITKSLNKFVKNRHEKTNQKLGYDGIKKKIERRSMYGALMIVHLFLYFGVLFLFVKSDYDRVKVGLWAIFVLMPHLGITIAYFARWSDKELNSLSKESDKPKGKPKEREFFVNRKAKPTEKQPFKFSEKWDK